MTGFRAYGWQVLLAQTTTSGRRPSKSTEVGLLDRFPQSLLSRPTLSSVSTRTSAMSANFFDSSAHFSALIVEESPEIVSLSHRPRSSGCVLNHSSRMG